jgi:NADPH-dependent 2,4-dienoyl-CoA reductase/sulfur reductase-like enzyme
MRSRWLRWVAVVGVALAVGFLIATWRAGATIETGQAHSKGAGGGSIVTSGWTYGFASDVAWTDAHNSWHEGGTPDCLPPLSIKDGVRFAWIEVTVGGQTWRPVVWIDCRGVPTP